MQVIFTVIGAIGALSFALCALPQINKTLKTEDASGISFGFIILSLIGNIFSSVYVAYTDFLSGIWQIPLFLNYGTALFLMIILMILKIKL